MSGARWWVEAQGRAWGPYAEARLPAFVAEGRLGPSSRVARDEAGPFAPASEALPDLFAGPAAPQPAPEPASLAAEAAGAAEEPSAAAAEPRTRLVITDAPEPELAAFEAALAPHGDAVRIRPGLWLLKSPADAAALRNGLSRSLRAPAMLLVVDAPAQGAAWFNLEGDVDRALRRLWSGS